MPCGRLPRTSIMGEPHWGVNEGIKKYILGTYNSKLLLHLAVKQESIMFSNTSGRPGPSFGKTFLEGPSNFVIYHLHFLFSWGVPNGAPVLQNTVLTFFFFLGSLPPFV